MSTYQVSVQYQAIFCKHRHMETIYVRTNSTEQAIDYAKSIPYSKDYIIRNIGIKELEVHDVA